MKGRRIENDRAVLEALGVIWARVFVCMGEWAVVPVLQPVLLLSGTYRQPYVQMRPWSRSGYERRSPEVAKSRPLLLHGLL